MALMYPWATKEYLLWQMTLPQILMYMNIGIDIKYPNPKSKDNSLMDKDDDELYQLREELRKTYGAV